MSESDHDPGMCDALASESIIQMLDSILIPAKKWSDTETFGCRARSLSARNARPIKMSWIDSAAAWVDGCWLDGITAATA